MNPRENSITTNFSLGGRQERADSITAELVSNVCALVPITDRPGAKIAQDTLTVLVFVHRRFFILC